MSHALGNESLTQAWQGSLAGSMGLASHKHGADSRHGARLGVMFRKLQRLRERAQKKPAASCAKTAAECAWWSSEWAGAGRQAAEANEVAQRRC